MQGLLAGPKEPIADGVYMDVYVVKGLIPKSLDTKNGAQILKVSEEQENDIVTIYIKKEKKDWLPDKGW